MLEGSRTPAAEAVSSFSGQLPTNTCASAAQVFPRHLPLAELRNAPSQGVSLAPCSKAKRPELKLGALTCPGTAFRSATGQRPRGLCLSFYLAVWGRTKF